MPLVMTVTKQMFADDTTLIKAKNFKNFSKQKKMWISFQAG